MMTNLVCCECSMPLIWINSSLVCSECGLVNDQYPEFINSKSLLDSKVSFQTPTYQFNEIDIKNILKKPISKNQIAIYTSLDKKLQNLIFIYYRIISQFRDEPSYLQENIKMEYQLSLMYLRKKLNKKKIPNEILAVYIIAKQFNIPIKKLEQYIDMNSKIGNLIKKLMNNQNTLPDYIDKETIKKINIIREKIRLKTRLWIKPKIIGLITGLIKPKTKQERHTKNHYIFLLKKNGLNIESLQSF